MPTARSGIDISKYEMVSDTMQVFVDDFLCRVYTRRLIVAEKLRALAQQRPEAYPPNKRVARARDFFDIHQVLAHENESEVLGEGFAALVARVFAAKDVPLALSHSLHEDRALHAQDWRSVLDTAGDPSALPSIDFDFYFDFVLELIARRFSQKPRGT